MIIASMKIITLLVFATVASGQTQSIYGQCGGNGWAGPKACAASACCVYSNDYYSQCLNGPCSSKRPVSSTFTTSQKPTNYPTISSTILTSTLSRTSSVTSSSVVTSSSTSRSTTTASSTTTSSSRPSASASAPALFTNPIIYQDLPDNDVFLGPDGYFYLSASNFHFSPGAPIYRSKDLQNWEAYGHSVPTLDFGDSYSLIGGQAYRRGTWASSMRYRKGNKTWYWIGCIDFYNSFIYTASSAAGPWTRSASLYARCYYDCGLFIDDDDTMYIGHGSNNVNVTQLNAAGLAEVRTTPMASNPAGFDGMEGNRLYKRNGTYYILNDSGSGQITWIWRSSSPFGPWTSQVLQQYSGGPVPTGGTPHQGSLVETSLGDWYFVSFTWTFPLGRIPVIAPITWGSDGWPVLGLVGGKWNVTYPNPLPQVEMPSWSGTDSFPGTSLGLRWEWNHNPDTNKFAINNGVTLSAATVTDDLYLARNTLTHRPQGPNPVATIVLDTTTLADGDRAGLSAFGILSAYIGVVRIGSTYSIVNRQGMELNTSDWSTISTGTDIASVPITQGKIWLRGTADPLGTKNVSFQYSTDGTTFTSLGSAYTLSDDYSLFMGFRWGIFNFATKGLGGSVKVLSYTQ